MFERLTDRLQAIFQSLGGKGRLTERDVDEAMREVRTRAARGGRQPQGRARVRRGGPRAGGRPGGADSLTPAQTVIKIVHEELINVLGEGAGAAEHGREPPTLIMLVGLQRRRQDDPRREAGALSCRSRASNPLMVAADVYRPAAITQLQTLGGQIGVPVYAEGTERQAARHRPAGARAGARQRGRTRSSSTLPAASRSTKR